VLFGLVAWLPTASWELVALLVIGNPFFGALYTPASALTSEGAKRAGLGFGLSNLTWAGGHAAAASVAGALAEATSDMVPYLLLSLACLLSLAAALARHRIVRPQRYDPALRANQPAPVVNHRLSDSIYSMYADQGLAGEAAALMVTFVLRCRISASEHQGKAA
jgi:MFS family permease